MKTFLALNKLPFSLKPTINFLKDIDKLFDILNSYIRPSLKNFNKPFNNSEAQNSNLLFLEKLLMKIRKM